MFFSRPSSAKLNVSGQVGKGGRYRQWFYATIIEIRKCNSRFEVPTQMITSASWPFVYEKHKVPFQVSARIGPLHRSTGITRQKVERTTLSPELFDATIYVIDVAAGGQNTPQARPWDHAI